MITKQEIEQYTLKEIDESFDTALARWITQATEYIQTYTGREFIVPETAETRVFDGNNKYEILLGDFFDLSEVTVDDESIEVFEYPANKQQKYKITSSKLFKRGRQNIEVTAKFGFVSIPEDIKFACLVLVAGIINVQVNGNKSNESIGNYSVSYTTEAQRDDHNRAMKTLQMYRDIPL